MPWITMPDNLIRHIWAPKDAPDGEGEISVEPTFYAEAGTPVDPETGDDLIHVRTELLVNVYAAGEAEDVLRIISEVKEVSDIPADAIEESNPDTEEGYKL